jgi:hypothetical protein
MIMLLVVPKLFISEYEFEGSIIRVCGQYAVTEAASWVLVVDKVSFLLLLLGDT